MKNKQNPIEHRQNIRKNQLLAYVQLKKDVYHLNQYVGNENFYIKSLEVNY